MFFPRVVIAGTQSGVGKTTLSLAIMAALTKRKLLVQPFKVGPDYIDPSFHYHAVGRHSCNLDAWLVPEKKLQTLFSRRALPAISPDSPHTPHCNGEASHASPSIINIIEGVMGLYDGQGSGAWASTAHVASLLQAPVLLTVNARGMSLSAAALVSGYAGFAGQYGNKKEERTDLSSLRIAGVVLNQVSGARHYRLLSQCIEEHTGIPCLGYIGRGAISGLPERHLGLVQAGEITGLDHFFKQLADMAEESLDLPGIIKIARSAPELIESVPDACKKTVRERANCASAAKPPRLRIGVPKDEAFSFYYPDNLRSLEDCGATLVYFSPLHDRELPGQLDGLYMGGGFPEVFAEALEANISFRASMASALENGLPAYAECGAMMYLCSSIRTLPSFGKRRSFNMAGFFTQHAIMTDRLQPFGYVKVTLLRDCLLGKAGTAFRAHEFHYACIDEQDAEPLYLIEKEDGRSWKGGLCKKNVVAGFPHLHFYGCPDIAAAFLSNCRNRTTYAEHSL